MNSLGGVWISFGLILVIIQLMIPSTSGQTGALYFLSNNPDPNQIIITTIQANGSLAATTKLDIATTKGIPPPPRDPSEEVGPLHSQHSIIVVGLNLFNVNYGSNSISLHTIDATDPTKLTHVQTVPSGGDKPNCLAYLESAKLLCVANAGTFDKTTKKGTKSGIQCFKVDGTITPIGGLKGFGDFPTEIGLPYFAGFGSSSDILFTQKGKFLTVSIKGVAFVHPDATNGGKKESHQGYIFNYPVNADGSGIGEAIKNDVGVIAYSMTVINPDDGYILYTDPGRGQVRTLMFNGDGKKVCGRGVAIPNQANICWSAFSQKTSNFYITDASDMKETGQITEISIGANPFQPEIVGKQIPGAELFLDLSIVPLQDADYMYVIHAAPGDPAKRGIFVIKLAGPGNMEEETTKHHYPTGADALPLTIQGMAFHLVP